MKLLGAGKWLSGEHKCENLNLIKAEYRFVCLKPWVPPCVGGGMAEETGRSGCPLTGQCESSWMDKLQDISGFHRHTALNTGTHRNT